MEEEEKRKGHRARPDHASDVRSDAEHEFKDKSLLQGPVAWEKTFRGVCVCNLPYGGADVLPDKVHQSIVHHP